MRMKEGFVKRWTAHCWSLLYRQEFALAGYEFCISTLEEKIEREKELAEDVLSGRETWLFSGRCFLPQSFNAVIEGRVPASGEGKLPIWGIKWLFLRSQQKVWNKMFFLNNLTTDCFLTLWWHVHNLLVDLYIISGKLGSRKGRSFLFSWFSYQSQCYL